MSKPSRNPSASKERALEELKDYCLTLLISGAAGALVALPFSLWYATPLPADLLSGALAGVLIGLVSRTGFVLVLRHLHSRPFWAFVFIILAVGGGTLTGGLVFGLSDALPLALLVGLAETVGLVITLIKYRYSLVLNDRLRDLQRKIQAETEQSDHS